MLIRFWQKNGIVLSIVLIAALLVGSATMYLYNRHIMAKTVVLQQQADRITSTSKTLFENALASSDKSLRAYALTKGDNHLTHFQNALASRAPVSDSLITFMNSQKEFLPVFQVTIDSLITQQKQVNNTLEEYHLFSAYMADLAKKDSMTEFMSLLGEDRGLPCWATWNRFHVKLSAFESNIIQDAQNDYDVASNRNAWIQGLLILLGLPTLYWIVKTLKTEERNRKKLLSDLKYNNQQYLFHPGENLQDTIIADSIQNLQKAATFVKKVTQGDYSVHWEGLNESNQVLNQENLVGELLKMQQQMKLVKEEDQKRNWTNEGLNYLNEILRKEADLPTLANRILAELIKYLDANQGVLFILNNTSPATPYLELKATYAFNRKKYISGRIERGQGLAGQAWLEAETIYLKEIPQDYVRITSGLGDATPNNLLVVPLKHDQTIQGVLELASFKLFQPHQISFVEKIAETIATTFAAARITEHTTRLLEESQDMAEQMRAQEEEMRQNMEELTAIQEELQRKERETSNLIYGINSSFGMVEFDLDGTILSANEKFLGFMGYTLEEVKGRKHQLFVTSEYAASNDYRDFWQNLKQAHLENATYSRLKKDRGEIWLRASYVPLRNKEGQVYKILKLATDITNEHQIQKQSEERMATIEAYEEEMKHTLNDLMQQQEEVSIKEQEYMQRVAELEAENQNLKNGFPTG